MAGNSIYRVTDLVGTSKVSWEDAVAFYLGCGFRITYQSQGRFGRSTHFALDLADGVAHIAAARVQHHPDRFLLIKAKLDEVIAAAERTELAPDARVIELADAIHDAQRVVSPYQAIDAPLQRRCSVVPTRLQRGFVRMESDGNVALDLRANHRERIGEIGRFQGRAYRDHTAADVHTDGGGNDGAARGNHCADGRALAEMHVGHDRDMPAQNRQRRDVANLPAGRFLDRDALRPHANVVHIVLEYCRCEFIRTNYCRCEFIRTRGA